MIDQAEAARLFTYHPDEGFLTWNVRPLSDFKTEIAGKAWNTKFSGKRAGSTHCITGYRYINVGNGKFCYEHRIVWLLHNGHWPVEVDHANGERTDNRIENLSDTDRLGNCKNMARKSTNKSGRTGVHFDRRASKWMAYIDHQGRKNLGHFDTFEEAVKVREAAEVYYNFHKNHDRVPA